MTEGHCDSCKWMHEVLSQCMHAKAGTVVTFHANRCGATERSEFGCNYFTLKETRHCSNCKFHDERYVCTFGQQHQDRDSDGWHKCDILSNLEMIAFTPGKFTCHMWRP